MADKINRYQFDKIYGTMKSSIEPIKKGDEGFYEVQLWKLEYLILNLRKETGVNGRHFMEVLKGVLYDIRAVLDGKEYDYSSMLSEDEKMAVKRIELLFMPFNNPGLEKKLKSLPPVDDKEGLKEYFDLPVKCLIRVYESMQMWTKESGVDGYFNFIEGFVGAKYNTSNPYLIENRFYKKH